MPPAKPGYEIAVQEDGHGRRAGSKPAAAERAAAGAARQRRCRPRRGLRQEVRRLPHLRQGRPEPRRPEPLRRRRPPEGIGAGFNYSAAMKAQKGNWTPEDLDHFLTNPKAMVPGTNMTFAGIPRGKERADLIAFLNGKSDKPAALPKQAAAGSSAQGRSRPRQSGRRLPR